MPVIKRLCFKQHVTCFTNCLLVIIQNTKGTYPPKLARLWWWHRSQCWTASSRTVRTARWGLPVWEGRRHTPSSPCTPATPGNRCCRSSNNCRSSQRSCYTRYTLGTKTSNSLPRCQHLVRSSLRSKGRPSRPMQRSLIKMSIRRPAGCRNWSDTFGSALTVYLHFVYQ